MTTKFIVGADISKATIHFCLFKGSQNYLQREIANEKSSLKNFILEIISLKKSYEKSNSCTVDIVFACEFTGIYNYILTTTLAELKIETFVIHALNIKLSMGMTRGKNDAIDAIMIAEYTLRFSDKLRVWNPDDATIGELKHLETLRARYVKSKIQLSQCEDDYKKFTELSIYQTIKGINDPVIEALENAITLIEKQMLILIKNNEALKNTYEILNSVPGIGPVIARSIICITNNFTKFDSAKKFGCYCGVVPFNNSSGSYKGKNKVSKLADKGMKKLIHLGAMSIINSENQFGKYYKRKIAEGKHHTLVVNNIRNKIIITAFACVTKGKKYKEDYVYAA